MATDRRIRRTETALRVALIKQLKVKPISKITIKELCEEADINRGTFYAHYADQYALLDSVIRGVADGIHDFFANSEKAKDEAEVYALIVRAFQYVRKNAELCSVLLSKNTRFDFSDLVIQFMMEKNFFNMQEYKIKQEKAKKYVCSFISNGALGIFKGWLNDGMEESDETMARLLISLVNSGIKNFQ